MPELLLIFFASPPPPSPLLLPTLPLLLLPPTVHFHGFDPRFPHLHFINFATSFHNPLQPISARMYRFRSYNVKLYFMLSVHLLLLGCRTPMGGMNLPNHQLVLHFLAKLSQPQQGVNMGAESL